MADVEPTAADRKKSRRKSRKTQDDPVLIADYKGTAIFCSRSGYFFATIDEHEFGSERMAVLMKRIDTYQRARSEAEAERLNVECVDGHGEPILVVCLHPRTGKLVTEPEIDRFYNGLDELYIKHPSVVSLIERHREASLEVLNIEEALRAVIVRAPYRCGEIEDDGEYIKAVEEFKERIADATRAARKLKEKTK